MVNAWEKQVYQSLYDHYPEWWATKHFVSFGQSITIRQQRFHFDKQLLLTKHPNFIDLLRAGYAYARYKSQFEYKMFILASADHLFTNCYFLHHEEAESFSTAVHLPRYLVSLAKRTFEECYILFAKRNDFNVMQITLEVVYHVEGEEFIQTEDIDLPQPNDGVVSEI